LATALEHFVPTNQTQLAENNAGENPRSWRKSKKLTGYGKLVKISLRLK
jgi:hypothetical protein